MPTPFDYDPEAFEQLQRILSGVGEGFRTSYRNRPQEPFLTIEDLGGALTGIPMDPTPTPDIGGAVERAGQAASRALPATTGYRTPSLTTRPGAVEREPREVGLAGVMQTTAPEGWQSAPGGRYRVEKPPFYALRTPGGLQADAAARSWQDYNRAKYGAGYTNERTVGTPEYEAGGAASLGYSNLVDKILKAAEAQGRPELLGKPLEDVFTGWGELGKSEADILASREARAEKEAQRRENAWLMQQFLGGGAPPGGVSEKTLKTGTAVAQARRAQEAAERADRRLDESERRGRMAGPSRSDIITRAQRILLESGRTVKKTPDGDLVVYQNNKPVKDGEKLLAGALKEAERQIRSGAP